MKVAIEYRGGPFNGVDEFDELQALRHHPGGMALTLYRDYTVKPPKAGVGWWFMAADLESDVPEPHYYKIVSGEEADGVLRLVCEYGGTEHPTDHSHDDE